MKQTLADQKDATIYQYRLVKRILIKPELVISHSLIAAVFLGVQLLVYQMDGLFAWLFGFAAIQLLHIFIILLTFISVTEATDRQWSWRISPPWIGFKPINDITLRIFRRVHRHLFWLGLCVIAVLYPWIKTSLLISLICWHVWVVAPRLMLSFAFRKQLKDGVLRLQMREASYYHR